MNFNYRNYVARMNYQPYQWPPDISLAQLHSRVSEQGPVNQNGVQCPCCKYQSKKKFTNWIWRDISQDCQGLGSSVPAYFGLLKYYIVAIFMVIAINGIYPIWSLFYTCQKFIVNEEQSCLKVGLLYYLDYDIQLNVLINNQNRNIADNLIILQTITYYFLFFVNMSSVWYLFYMEKKEENLHLEHVKASKIALIIGNIKEVNPERIKEKLRIETKLEIIDIIPLQEIKRYHELYYKRNTLYYNLLSFYVKSQDPKKYIKINKELYHLQKQLLLEKKHLQQNPVHTILVIFQNPEMATIVYNHYQMLGVTQYCLGTKALIEQLGLSKQILQAPYYACRVPSVKEIRWENTGQDIKVKLSGKIKTFLIALGIIALLFFIFQEPLRYSLQTHTGSKDLSTIQKVLPVILSFLIFGISIFFRNYMASTTKKRNPLNEYEASLFVLNSSMIFHIVFYIIIPSLFFFINDGIDTTVKLYVISQQARTFIIMQMILCFIDIPYRVWKNRKTSVLGDQREGFKYNQKMLHKVVEYKDFPLEQRLQSMFKIWSLALFYSFYLPYILYYIFLALAVLFILQKRNFYLHYTLRRSISLKLQKNFLIYFVNFFVIFQCLTYLMNAQYDWMIYTTVPITAICLVLNFVFWKIFQPRFRKEKEKETSIKSLQEKLLKKGNESGAETAVIDRQLQKAKEISQEYTESYKNFCAEILNEKLDNEIQQYLSSFAFHKDGQIESEIQRQIQLASSYTQLDE